MKKYFNILMALALSAAVTGCKEDPFGSGNNAEEQGSILKSSIMVELQNEDGMAQMLGRPGMTRAEVPAPEDFTVNFYKDDAAEPCATYLFSEMPEVVTLPVGAIRAVASFGENAPQAWEAPYYSGETQFIISSGKVTDNIDPIVARLSNVRVTISFAPGLKEKMAADAKVTVVVGENGTLDFTAEDESRSGYFAHVKNSQTLTATFSGKVDGFQTVETKGYDNVEPGHHYHITFKLHDPAEDGEGDINGSVSVDASVADVDMNVSVDDEDEPIEDDMRPVEGDPENPDKPDVPGPTPGEKTAPAITPAEPAGENAGMNKVNLDTRNSTDNLYCAFKVTSEAEGGITEFKVTINSDKLTPDELTGVGLAQNLDLVNPGDLAGALEGLGFPINVGGSKSVDFNITSFLPMLAALGSGNSDFVLTVTDANGTTVKTIMLRVD